MLLRICAEVECAKIQQQAVDARTEAPRHRIARRPLQSRTGDGVAASAAAQAPVQRRWRLSGNDRSRARFRKGITLTTLDVRG